MILNLPSTEVGTPSRVVQLVMACYENRREMVKFCQLNLVCMCVSPHSLSKYNCLTMYTDDYFQTRLATQFCSSE